MSRSLFIQNLDALAGSTSSRKRSAAAFVMEKREKKRAALGHETRNSQPKIEANILVNQLLAIYPAMRQPFSSFEKRITGSKAFGRNELAKLLLSMIKQFLVARQDGMRDFEYVASSMKKTLAGLESNSRRGNGTYEKMRLSKAYITSLQNCLGNLSDLIVSSILPLQCAAVERFLSEVNHKITKSSEAEKRLEKICGTYRHQMKEKTSVQVKAGRSFFDLLDDESNAAKEEDVVGNLEKLLNHSLGKLNNHKANLTILMELKNFGQLLLKQTPSLKARAITQSQQREAFSLLSAGAEKFTQYFKELSDYESTRKHALEQQLKIAQKNLRTHIECFGQQMPKTRDDLETKCAELETMSKTCEQSRSEMAANLVKFLDVTEVILREKVPETLRQLWCCKITDLAQLSDHGASIAVRIKSLHDGLKKTVAPKKGPSDSSTVLAPAAATGSNVMEVEPAKPLISPVPQAAPVRSRPSSAPGAFGANSSFSVGTRVLAKWKGQSKTYPAVIASVNSDGTHDLKYDDGFQEKGVAKHLIQQESPVMPSQTLTGAPIPPPLPSFPKKIRGIMHHKQQPPQAFKNGTRVNVRMQNGKRFAGIVKRRVRVGTYSVKLETGRTLEVDSNQLHVRIKPTIPPSIHHEGWKCALKVDMPVVAKWKGSYKMWSAKIVAINSDGKTFSLHYDDGDKDQRVPRASICAKVPPKTEMPVGKLQTPAVSKLQTPAVRKLQTPAVRKLQNPAVSNLQTPVARQLQTPAARKLQISAATTTLTAPKFAVGTVIEARWKGGIKYYRGKIDKINADGTYAIHHDDGDYARSVITAHIRPVPPPKKSLKPKASTKPLAEKVTTIKVGFKVQRNDRKGFIKKVHGNSTFDVEYYDDGLTECDLRAYQFRVLSRTIDGVTEPKIDANAELTHKQTELAKRIAKVGEKLEQKSKTSWYNPFGFFSS